MEGERSALEKRFISAGILKNMRKNAAATLMASWMQTGSFDVKIKKTELSGDESEVRVTCIVCSGDLCEKQELRLFPPPRDLCLTARLLIQLLAQPLAIASASCFMLLAASCIFPSVFTDAVLSLVGGRSNGWLVLTAANAAHVFESAVAFAVMIRLGAGARAAVGWSLLTALIGFPVLRHVLVLRKTAEREVHHALKASTANGKPK